MRRNRRKSSRRPSSWTWIKTQLPLAEQVHSCYEAGPFGYGLHRTLIALGVHNLVVQPVCLDEHAGVILFRRSVSAIAYGRQARLLVDLWREAEDWDWADRIEYLPRP